MVVKARKNRTVGVRVGRRNSPWPALAGRGAARAPGAAPMVDGDKR